MTLPKSMLAPTLRTLSPSPVPPPPPASPGERSVSPPGLGRPGQDAPSTPRGRRSRIAGATRAGWVAALVVAVLAAMVFIVLVSPDAGSALRPAVPGVAEGIGADEVVIGPGETLWEVAVRHAPPGTDPRAYLAALREHNRLGPSLPAWTVIELPGSSRPE